ncbi:MAG TPA: nuclease-related domain-containing protein [Pseudolysinimonas sp.]|nr:nuclease-related domain-containing protein [Pseudolysinimonas sp.]
MRRCLEIQAQKRPRGAVARFFGRTPLHPDAVPAFRGALGELQMADRLAGLGAEWTVLHAVPVGRTDADIDHVLIGPSGVFTVSTRNHHGEAVWVGGGTFLINGHRTAQIELARAEARDAATRLSRHLGELVDVTPVLVLIDPASLTRGKKSTEVTVLTSDELVPWLHDRPAVLSAAERARIEAIAEKRSTWHAVAVSPDDTQPHVRRFAMLLNEVERAARRRRVVLTVAGILLAGVVLSGIAWVPPVVSALVSR